jgi:hypothetical protein
MQQNVPYPNPYAPPQAPFAPAYGQPSYPGSVVGRIEGGALVVPNGAALPHVCVKCGTQQPLEFRNQKFSFVPVWARFFGPLIQLIVMKKSAFSLPVCPGCHKQWKKWNLYAGVFSWLPSVVLFIVGGALGAADQEGAAAICYVLGTVVFLVLLIVLLALRLKYVVTATRIDKTHSWLSRMHPEALRAATGT